jgi:hypothetical protein
MVRRMSSRFECSGGENQRTGECCENSSTASLCLSEVMQTMLERGSE